MLASAIAAAFNLLILIIISSCRTLALRPGRGSAIGLQDKTAVSRAPGVGPKLAARIVAELKDKAPSMMLRGPPGEATVIAPRGPEADAVAALGKLGYSQGVAAEAIARAARDLGDDAALDALIREALRAMGR